MKFFSGLLFAVLTSLSAFAQEDEELLEELLQSESKMYVSGTFKDSRIVNMQTVETSGDGELHFLISHRFGRVNTGAYNLFGLDEAWIRLGLTYGITDRLSIGIGRSNIEKTFDGFIKYKVLRQCSGQACSPVTVTLLAGSSIYTLRTPFNERLTDRLTYSTQLLIARKFTRNLSLQLTPAWIHRNLVASISENNDVFALGLGGRMKVTRRISVNAEYWLTPGQLPSSFHNSASLGVDIETGGHVFQLHVTNSRGMIEKQFITETTGNWLDGDIHFGFNISRVFQLKHKKPKQW